MRVVLDTNVFISGVFWRGRPADVLDAVLDGRIEAVLSAEILEEYQRVGLELGREHPDIDLEPIINGLVLIAGFVSVPSLLERVCSDPDDDKFIAAAIAGKAAFVISGDRALLGVREYAGVRIVKPAWFVTKYLKGGQ
jgi:putative PIN family toxin of toxin-antitoxin system